MNEGLEKYKVCRFCDEAKQKHVGPKLQCLFSSTYFEPLKVQGSCYVRLEDRICRNKSSRSG